MPQPDHDGLHGNGKARKLDADPEWQSILASFGDKIETSPWPEQPLPPPKPEPRYSVQPWKDTGFWAVMKETTGGKKDLVVVAAFKKGADEVVKRFEALERENKNLKHTARLAKYDVGP